MAPALILAAVYLIWEPPSADLAAQTFRADLFASQGFEAWSNAWYGGIHLPGYSLLFPPLASLLGVRLVGALSAVAAAWLFDRLVRSRFGGSARLASFLFGLGAATNLFTGRLTFALGVAVALAALLAVDRDRRSLAAGLALATSLASPVAGLFLALAGGVLLLTGRSRDGVALAAPSLAGIGAFAVLFPTTGHHPFSASTFVLIAAAAGIVLALAPGKERWLRTGVGLFVLLCLGAFLVETPVGGNATRLGALLAAPLLALVAWGRRPSWVVVLALLPLLYWQWVAPVRDLADAVGEKSVEESYYEPLLDEIGNRAPEGAFRVHVPPTRNRWEAVYVADRYPLARGWLRQAESDDFELFQEGNLDAETYRDWLDERGVALVAVSAGAKQDYLSEDEVQLLRSGISFANEVWSSDDWQLYEIEDPAPIAEAPARMSELTATGFVLQVPAAGLYEVKVRHSGWFEVAEGAATVSESDDGWTTVDAAEAGAVVIDARFP